MKFRAIIFDIYRTVLHVGLAPEEAEASWENLAAEFLSEPEIPTLSELVRNCEAVVEREHGRAKAAGVLHPEVYWPDIIREVLPSINQRSPEDQARFRYCQINLLRRLQLMPGAARVLRSLQDLPVVVGIASNAQPYTLIELEQALAPESLDLSLFDPGLRFWSWENGFSKPDPHVFRILSSRLQDRGIGPGEILMVGDRVDNDIEPSKAQGWEAWHLCDVPSTVVHPGGTWEGLEEFLELEP